MGKFVFYMIFVFLSNLNFALSGPEEKEGVIYASRCEACKILAIELQDRLSETGKSHDVLEIGYSVDDVKPKKRTEYRRSELRLLESLENVCERVLDYNLHKERKDSTRFAKGMSQTFKTLHNLVDKGVKVDLGIPLELWDKPPVEVTNMKTQCENLIEEYESDIETWYFENQESKPLVQYLCDERVLRSNDKKCLSEKLEISGDIKGDKGSSEENDDDDKSKDEL